jgi:hypothetical protein
LPFTSQATESDEIYRAAKQSFEDGNCENSTKLFNEYIDLEKEKLKKDPSFYKQIIQAINACKKEYTIIIHSRAKKAKKKNH